jgi:ethanolamine permease
MDAQAAGKPALKKGALSWIQVASLGVAIAISGNFAGWNFGLGVGGFGGMLLAALAMVALFVCLTQCLAELAVALPEGGGFDFYARRALGPAYGFLAGTSVAIALAVGAGLGISFAEAYISDLVGLSGWWVKLGLLALVIGLQLRGAEEAGSFTMIVGAIALTVLAVFCLVAVPQFTVVNLLSAAAGGGQTAFPRQLAGAAQCIPYALFLFLGVEQAAHAATEMKDMSQNMPKALASAIGIAFVIGISVLVLATGSVGAQRLSGAADPLLFAIKSHPHGMSDTLMIRVVGIGALLSIVGTFFSCAYAGSRQLYHLAGASYLPPWLAYTNRRHAPAAALGLLALITLGAAAFPPGSVMVIFIFLISVSHVLVLSSFLMLRRREPGLDRPFRALGGQGAAAVAVCLSIGVMVSCYLLEVTALSCAIAVLIALLAYFLVFRPGQIRAL